MMNKTILKMSLLALCLGAALPAAASSFVLDFDGLADGGSANGDSVAQTRGITFSEAQFVPDTDEFGDVIAGSEKWRPVAGAPAVLVRNPDSFAGGLYGAAPSGPNALDVREAPVLMTFVAPTDLLAFSVTLDNSSFGNVFPSDILFLGADNNVLASLSTDQSMPGFTGVLAAPVLGVKQILLGTTAYYDNIAVSAVPVPAAVWMFGSALCGMAGLKRRKTA